MAENSSTTPITGDVSGAFPDGISNINLGPDEDGLNIKLVVAAFTDGATTTLGEGSLVIDPSSGAGKLGVVIAGLIQTVTT